MAVLLVPHDLLGLLSACALNVALHVRQGHIDLRVFQLVVLIKTTLRTIGFSTGFYTTLIKSLDLICISSHPFSLLILPLAETYKLFILHNKSNTSYFLNLEAS